MALRFGPKVVKHCPEGHVMEMAQRTCPRCSGRRVAESAPERDMADATVIFQAAPAKRETAPQAPPPAPTWVALLTATTGPFAGRAFEIHPGRWKLGRGPSEEPGIIGVTLPDPGLSRDHFALEAGTAAVVLRDLGSTNGTFVNGSRVERHVLAEGDSLRAGETSFRVRVSPRPQS
jgi:hypothetical protein